MNDSEGSKRGPVFDDIRNTLLIAARFGRRQLATTVAWYAIAAAIQSFGVISVLPFLALAADPTLAAAKQLVEALEITGFEPSWPETLYLFGAVFAGLALLSHASKVYANYVGERYASEILHRLRTSTFDAVLSKDLSFFVQSDHARLQKIFLDDARLFVTSVLKPTLQLIASTLNIALILVAFLVIAPAEALVAMSVLLAYFVATNRWLIERISPRKSEVDSMYAQLHSSTRSALGDTRTMLTYGASAYFKRKLESSSQTIARFEPALYLVSALPRAVFESIGVVAIVIAICLLVAAGDSLSAALPAVGMSVLAAYRIIPSLQSAFAGLSRMRSFSHTSAVLDRTLSLPNAKVARGATSGSEMVGCERIELIEVAYSPSGASAFSISGINFLALKGEHIGIAGETGSGKSTLLDLLLGLVQPTSGRVLIDGEPILFEDARAWRAQVGYVPQEVILTEGTVLENIAYGQPNDQVDPSLARHAARLACAEEFITNELERGYETLVGERGTRLSGGQRQRIGLARAFYRNPTVLFLDEATSALDAATEARVMENLKAFSDTGIVVSITHRPSTLTYCDRYYEMRDGSIFSANEQLQGAV